MDTAIIFIVSRPGQLIENVILSARSREDAKRQCKPILGGDPDHYVVDPITKHGSQTVILFSDPR